MLPSLQLTGGDWPMISIDLVAHRVSSTSAATSVLKVALKCLVSVLGVSLSLFLLDCSTSVSAKRVGTDGVVDGVPLRLPVASFVITETPASADKPTTYALGLVQSPSADELYSVRLKPGWMSSSDLKLAFGAQGQLTGLNASSSPAAAPAIQALGEFVVGVVGVGAKVAATGVVNASDGGGPGLIGELEETKEKPDEVCRLRSDLRHTQEDVQADRGKASAYLMVLDSCKKNVPNLLGPMLSRLNPDLDLAANFARLYPTNETQRAALEATAARVRTYGQQHLGSAEKAIDERTLAQGLAEAAKLSAREWRNRHATVIEDRIDALGRELARETDLDPRKLAVREQLQREWAVTVDGLAEFERAEMLRRLLLRAPAKIADYALARAELDVLSTTLAQKRQVLRPSMVAPAKAKPREIRVVPEHYDGPGPSTKAWVAERAKALGDPEFIVVVEHGVMP